MTEEIFNRLTPYRKQLYTACNFAYVRLTSVKEKEDLAEIYKDNFNKESGIMGGCSRCILRDCKALGVQYFAIEKEKKENKENKENKTIEEDGSNTKRKGRPKKSN